MSEPTWLRRFPSRGRPYGRAPSRCTVNVPHETYVALCNIADANETSLRGALELVVAGLVKS